MMCGGNDRMGLEVRVDCRTDHLLGFHIQTVQLPVISLLAFRRGIVRMLWWKVW